MSNVRFYKLDVLPSFDVNKHKGIFVHVTSQLTRTGERENYTYSWGKVSNENIKNIEIQKIRIQEEEFKTVKVPEWMNTRGVDVVESGLWFGGENGWELLSNDTISGAIENLDVDTVNTVISGNVSGGTELTFKGVKEVNGKIQQGDGISTITIGDGTLKISGFGATTSDATPTIPTVTATDVFSANDTADSTIALSNAFVFNSNDKAIGIRTRTAVSASNNIVTESDIASLSGAMHYKGGITAYPTPTADTKAGDTYVVTTEFTNSGTTYEVGDMFVANADGTSATYTVVQTNMTLGTGQGQVAANSAALTSGNLVVASETGINTTTYSLTTASSRTLAVANGNQDADTNIYHSATATDSLTILGQSREKTLKIASSNASIDVRGTNNNEVDIDLVWNTVLE